MRTSIYVNLKQTKNILVKISNQISNPNVLTDRKDKPEIVEKLENVSKKIYRTN